MFDFKHLNAIIIKPSFFKNSFFSLAFHALYFKISMISLIKPFFNLKEFIFIQENDGTIFKNPASGIYSLGTIFKNPASGIYSLGTIFKKWTIRLGKDGQFL